MNQVKTYRAIVQPLEPNCPTCMDGTAPNDYKRVGRATFVCTACNRDVSLAVFFLSDAEGIS